MTQPKKTRRPVVDLTGRHFGRLTVLRATDERTANGRVLWRCLCACGELVTVRGDKLQAGRKVNCGCRVRKRDEEFWKMAERIVS